MEKPRAPFRELTDADNVDILGTLNPRLWAAAQRAHARADFFELDPRVGQDWIIMGLMRTGAINGDHRRDLVQALQGARPPTVALTTQPQANGHTGPEPRPAKVPHL